MGETDRHADRTLLGGFSSILLGGVCLMLSGSIGGEPLALVGVAVTVAGLAVAALGLVPRPVLALGPGPARGGSWLEEDLETDVELPEPSLEGAGDEEPPRIPAPLPFIGGISASPVPPELRIPEPFAGPPSPWGGLAAAPAPEWDESSREPGTPELGFLEDDDVGAMELPTSLPFIPAASRSGAFRGGAVLLDEGWGALVAPSRAELAEEVERLRLQVDELSTPILVPGLSVLPTSHPSPGSFGLVTRVPEPPRALSYGSTRPASCSGCGDRAVVGRTGDDRCWGCGRTLCTTCFWRYGPGAGLHRCPSCYAGGTPAAMPLTIPVARSGAWRGWRARPPDELE